MTDNLLKFPSRKRIIHAGGEIDSFSVTLGIDGDDLDPEEISRALGCEPTGAHRKGDARRSRNSKVGPWQSGAWLLSIDGKAPDTIPSALDRLLALVPDDETLWSEIAERFAARLGFGIFLDEWNRGFRLSPDHVQRLARMKVALDFDIYGADPPTPTE